MLPAQRVGDHRGVIAASLREVVDAADLQSKAADGDLGRTDGTAGAVVEAERGRIHGVLGLEDDLDAVHAEANVVDEAGSEHVRLIEGEYLAAGGAMVAGAGNGTALQRGLAARIALDGVVAVQAVAGADLVAEVGRALIDVNRRDERTQELGARRVISHGDERQQLEHRGVVVGGDLLALRGGEHVARNGNALALAQRFVAQEEEGPVLPDRPAEVGAEVVALEGGLRRARLVEEVARIEVFVAQKLKQLAVEAVRAGARGHHHLRAGVAAELGAVGGVVHLELSDGVDGRLERHLAVGHVVQVDAVHHEVGGVFAATSGVHAE